MGVDIGSRADIPAKAIAHRRLALVLISDERPERAQNGDRVLIMHEGRVIGDWRAAISGKNVVDALGGPE